MLPSEFDGLQLPKRDGKIGNLDFFQESMRNGMDHLYHAGNTLLSFWGPYPNYIKLLYYDDMN